MLSQLKRRFDTVNRAASRRVSASPRLRVSSFRRVPSLSRLRLILSFLLVVSLVSGGCFLDKEIEPYYGRVAVPRAQEFRWSDGGLPRTFDPALAAAPPETDVVRAIYEGLTDYDPKTLTPVPGVAARWESSPDGREWTFYLRKDARWSNGEPVIARDFVRSWKRTLELGENAPHARLLENIVNARPAPVNASTSPQPGIEASPAPQRRANEKKESRPEAGVKESKPEQPPPPPAFGAEAVDDYTLRVRLQRPDINFPALVSHPVFRPVHSSVQALSDTQSAGRVVSNGPFQLSNAGRDGVLLERAGNYWDAQTVSLQRVRFVPARDAESALGAYREGEVDAVTNAGFEPLALKLLAPYKDFRRATYGALTYYSFNLSRAPFTDVRVREALSIAVDRDRISEDELGGATEPAKKFLPVREGMSAASDNQPVALERDAARAQSLLAEAGFPQGKGFPVIRLLINRNEQQRVVAQTVANMWRNVLGIETTVIMAKSWDDYEAAVRSGEYDVVRRGMVMQTTDEASNMRSLFEQDAQATQTVTTNESDQRAAEAAKSATNGATKEVSGRAGSEKPALAPVTSEAQALKELPGMPIYFASSYALVKPYVVGFDSNLLDAPSLKRVRIDTSWQPPQKTTAIWYKGNE